MWDRPTAGNRPRFVPSLHRVVTFAHPLAAARRVRPCARAATATRVVAYLVACAAGFETTGCSSAHVVPGGHRTHGDAPAPVVAIGVAPSILVLTGLRGEDPVERGTAIAIRDLNAEADRTGGLRFVMRVPRAEVRTAVAAAATFRDDASVIGVVGPTDSQSALDAVPVYSDVEHDGARGLVAISPTATSPVLSGRSAWLFRVCPDDAASSRAAARYAFDSLGTRRAAIVYATNVFGRGWSHAFADAFTALGGTVVMREPDSPQLTEWPVPYAAYAKRGRSDLLVVAGSAADALPLVRAAHGAGLVVPVLGSDALSDVRNPAERAEFRDVRYTAFFMARRPPTEVGRRFVASYSAVYGTAPTHQAALAYDAALLLGSAARAAGADRVRVRDYLAGIGSSHPAFVGATGAIAFDARHDVVDKAVTLTRVVDE